MTKLQTIIFPSTEMPAPEGMYFRSLDRGVIAHLSKDSVDIPARAKVSSDTFFNGFSVGKWRGICQFNDLNLAVTGRGKVLVRIGLHVLDYDGRWLQEVECALSDTPTVVEITAFPSLKDGILFFEIVALEETILTGGYYFTRTPPPNDVNLGIVVTHFNRKNYVLPAIRRVTEQLLQDPDLEGRISLIVVDNSQNITPNEAADATVIPNRNLGGAGGFTRGLLHLKDNGFSHCLFMDDDASCEIESIRRTFRILQYAKSPKLAVSGSMLREAAPTHLYEAGARFERGIVKLLRHGLNMFDVYHLLLAEAHDERIHYGAWWHFAFQIDQVKHFAYPFFVRGDDILFSLTNEFDIATMNGIGVWGEDFAVKESPFTRYLNLRSTLVIGFIQSSRSARSFARMYRRLVRQSLYSYNYSSARAFTLALQHVMEGPDFWQLNIDMVAVREELERFASGEKLGEVNFPDDTQTSVHDETLWHRFARRITLNGFLLPDQMIRDKTILARKHSTGDARMIYRFRRVLYTAPNGNMGYIAEYDKKRFWEELLLARRTARDFRRNFKKLREQYQTALLELTSESFWRETYGSDDKSS